MCPLPSGQTRRCPGSEEDGAAGVTRRRLNLPASPQLPRADIQFWNSRQSLEGLSVRSVFFGVFQSFVVLLYILDNETNFVVQVSVFIGVLIDLWKITKVMDVRVRPGHQAVSGAAGVGSGAAWPSQTLEPAPGGFPGPAALPGPRGFLHQGIFRVTRGAGELGTVGKGRGWNWLGVGGRRQEPAQQLATASLPDRSWTGSTRWQDSSPAQPSKTSPHTLSPRQKCMTM